MFGPCKTVILQVIFIELFVLLLLLVGGLSGYFYYRRRLRHEAYFRERVLEEIPLDSPYRPLTRYT